MESHLADDLGRALARESTNPRLQKNGHSKHASLIKALRMEETEISLEEKRFSDLTTRSEMLHRGRTVVCQGERSLAVKYDSLLSGQTE